MSVNVSMQKAREDEKLEVFRELYPRDSQGDTFGILKIGRGRGRFDFFTSDPAELEAIALASHDLAHKLRTQLAADEAARAVKEAAGEPMNMIELAQAMAAVSL